MSRYKIYRYENKQFNQSFKHYESLYPKLETEYTDTIPQDIVETLQTNNINNIEAPIIFIYNEEEYSNTNPVVWHQHFTFVIDLEKADISEDEINEEINTFINAIKDGEDVVGVFLAFVNTASQIVEPYLSHGLKTNLYSSGGDFNRTTIVAVYYG